MLDFGVKECYSTYSYIRNRQKSGRFVHSSLVHGKVFRHARKTRERMLGLSKREHYEQRTEELLIPILETHGFELVDVEYVKEGSTWYLRAYIDKPGGIAINDCEVVSRSLSDVLDEKDFIEDSYILEVSSPGLGRPLKKERDFERSLGKEVDIRTYRMIDRQKDFTGTLESYDKDSVTIRCEDESSMTFDKKDIALIRLAFDF